MAKISLCVISSNEEPAIEGFLDSFKEAFDELCIVRAVGSLVHDRTISLAKDWCRKNAKGFKAGEYRNESVHAAFNGQGIDEHNPVTWPHVSDFAAARNQAWAMASHPWQMWADVDDLLEQNNDGGSEKIRQWAERGTHDQVFFTYDLRTQGESVMRERLFRTGVSAWVQPLHEQCHLLPERDGKPWKKLHEARIIIKHAPQANKQRDPMRNRRIMGHHIRYIHAFAFEMHREYFYDWCAYKKPEDAEQATKWAELAAQTNCLAEQRFDMLLHQAKIACEKDPEHAKDLIWSAIRINPRARDGWGDLAGAELRSGKAARAAVATAFMQSVPKQQSNGYPRSEHYHGWQGAHLRALTLRASGQEAAARKLEDDIFAKAGKRISLLHATRGRPKQALEARNMWFRAAFVPLGVEHTFAIDADDKESIEELKHYRHVIVENPNGCVRAWNAAAAASSGQVLIQLSDDWTPCADWDAEIWDALKSASQEPHRNHWWKSAEPTSNEECVGRTPLVLAIHDGHRTDALLCMAILTRARYEQQREEIDAREAIEYPGGNVVETGQIARIKAAPYLFSPEYFGVFSDNEFTHRAYDDGVVVQAQHIVFAHNHPFFEGKPIEKWDATHQRQNAPERYREGLEIFLRRNPKYADQYKASA